LLLLKGGAPFVLVKLNIVNLNRQAKMYSQGMTPVFRMVPGRSHWDRIKEKPSYTVCTYGREKDWRLLPCRVMAEFMYVCIILNMVNMLNCKLVSFCYCSK